MRTLIFLLGLGLMLIGVDRLARALLFSRVAESAVTRLLVGSACVAAGMTVVTILALTRRLRGRR